MNVHPPDNRTVPTDERAADAAARWRAAATLAATLAYTGTDDPRTR